MDTNAKLYHTIPVPASAGFTVMVTLTPVCRPFPENEIGAFSVCCLVDISGVSIYLRAKIGNFR